MSVAKVIEVSAGSTESVEGGSIDEFRVDLAVTFILDGE